MCGKVVVMAGATTTFGSVSRECVSRVLSVLPATAPMVIYKTILKPRPDARRGALRFAPDHPVECFHARRRAHPESR
jgi:hypothetical protein